MVFYRHRTPQCHCERSEAISLRTSLLFITFCLLANPAFAAYLYSRSITIPSSGISGGVDLTKFPILVCGNASSGACNASIPGMATAGNGGHVQNSSGYDIIFTTDSACSNKLTWEMESYIASTGEFEAWVTNTSTALSHSTNTTFYMCYGNASISTFQSTASSVWDSNYVGVWHLPNGSSLTANDSTTNGNTGTVTGTVTATSGQIDGGALTGSSGTNNIQVNNSSNLNITGSVTMESWVYPTVSNVYQGIVMKALGNDGNREYSYFLSQSGTSTIFIGVNRETLAPYDTYENNVALSQPWTVNAWNHIVIVVNAGVDIRIYINSILSATLTGNYGAVAEGYPLWFGSENSSFPLVNGKIDEIRVSNTPRSAGWITTEYNNQSAPSSFYTLGSEINAGTTSSTFQGHSIISGNSTIY